MSGGAEVFSDIKIVACREMKPYYAAKSRFFAQKKTERHLVVVNNLDTMEANNVKHCIVMNAFHIGVVFKRITAITNRPFQTPMYLNSNDGMWTRLHRMASGKMVTIRSMTIRDHPSTRRDLKCH
ncbi:hypothetical protein TcasGA2_TC003015 [Tribolium castaneum]|uniref:Uncharacterized protein n=1 Tax=Tribolium castaneum TaxID=7070 RepID=D6WG79_TRICA|nr:hypothetical protein TcasGA2_TC003015 [Tribolium castaneum]